MARFRIEIRTLQRTTAPHTHYRQTPNNSMRITCCDHAVEIPLHHRQHDSECRGVLVRIHCTCSEGMGATRREDDEKLESEEDTPVSIPLQNEEKLEREEDVPVHTPLQDDEKLESEEDTPMLTPLQDDEEPESEEDIPILTPPPSPILKRQRAYIPRDMFADEPVRDYSMRQSARRQSARRQSARSMLGILCLASIICGFVLLPNVEFGVYEVYESSNPNIPVPSPRVVWSKPDFVDLWGFHIAVTKLSPLSFGVALLSFLLMTGIGYDGG